MAKIKVLVCCHKATYVPNDDVYLPIQVGKANSKIDLGFQGDDEGKNISEKNFSYCELTAVYWAWKNLKDIDYIEVYVIIEDFLIFLLGHLFKKRQKI